MIANSISEQSSLLVAFRASLAGDQQGVNSLRLLLGRLDVSRQQFPITMVDDQKSFLEHA